jgi:hypothetical protein
VDPRNFQLGGLVVRPEALTPRPGADILPGIINMPRVDGFRRVSGLSQA